MGRRKWLGKGVWVVRLSLGEVRMGLAPEDDRPEHASHSHSRNTVLPDSIPALGLGVDFHVALLFAEDYNEFTERAWGWGPPLAVFHDLGEVTKRGAILEAPWRRSCGWK